MVLTNRLLNVIYRGITEDNKLAPEHSGLEIYGAPFFVMDR